MTLPSAPNSISMSQVNTELLKSATALISLNDSDVRALAGVGGSGTIISMGNLRGKTNVILAFGNSDTFNIVQFNIGTAIAEIGLDTTGTIFKGGNITSLGPSSWLFPTGTGAGGNYEARVILGSLVNYYGSGGTVSFGGVAMSPNTTSPYYNLSTNRSLNLGAPRFSRFSTTGTLEIRKVGGSPVITRSFYLEAEGDDT